MKTIGIIAEYNPLHLGHIYQIKKAKELYPDSTIILITNTTFTERGEVSILNKWTKTELSLENEIDLVIEREGKIYPVEFKKAATVSKADVKRFNKLSNFNMPVGTGALISLYPDAILIKENVKAIPAFAL